MRAFSPFLTSNSGYLLLMMVGFGIIGVGALRDNRVPKLKNFKVSKWTTLFFRMIYGLLLLLMIERMMMQEPLHAAMFGGMTIAVHLFQVILVSLEAE